MTKSLRPVHYSVRKVGKLKPQNMTRIDMPHEQTERLSQVALDIFTDCSNVGQGFADSLLAVYLSGLHHGSEARSEQ